MHHRLSGNEHTLSLPIAPDHHCSWSSSLHRAAVSYTFLGSVSKCSESRSWCQLMVSEQLWELSSRACFETVQTAMIIMLRGMHC